MTREEQMEDLLARTIAAASAQLSGMGRGKEPSDRLQGAIDEATELLGYDPIAKHDRGAALREESERLRAELRAKGVNG